MEAEKRVDRFVTKKNEKKKRDSARAVAKPTTPPRASPRSIRPTTPDHPKMGNPQQRAPSLRLPSADNRPRIGDSPPTPSSSSPGPSHPPPPKAPKAPPHDPSSPKQQRTPSPALASASKRPRTDQSSPAAPSSSAGSDWKLEDVFNLGDVVLVENGATMDASYACGRLRSVHGAPVDDKGVHHFVRWTLGDGTLRWIELVGDACQKEQLQKVSGSRSLQGARIERPLNTRRPVRSQHSRPC